MAERARMPAVAAGYVGVLPHLSRAARENGYALGVHGSMTTDLDLIAVPWTDDAVDAETLIAALCDAVGGNLPGQVYDTHDPASIRDQPAVRPHGRRAWSIHLPIGGPYLDVSVMPRQP